ncbi:ATP-binding protein [Candidatus Pacearchaeota archaeon]|nr:ATP-binding protein [Candidatus Pacearchaeota archaeon]
MPYDIQIGRNDEDKKLFGEDGFIFLGKSYVKMGNYTSISNRILVDVARNHVIMVAGKRGSGKSYTLGVIAEELANLKKEISQNIGSLIFDTMGIFWTMKYSNEKDKELLYEWKLNPERANVNIFVPFGYYDFYLEQGIPADEKFALSASELDSEDWIMTFGLSIINPVAVLIERVLKFLKQESYYTIKDIMESIELDEKSSNEVKNAAISLFEAAGTWGIFAEDKREAMALDKLISGGKTTVLDLSVYNSVGAFNVRALVIGLLCKKIFNQRMAARKKEEIKAISNIFSLKNSEEKRETPLVWIFIDEAHEFLPLNGKTSATDALVQLLREGRQPGISLVLATQQPGQIHKDAMTQSDIVISHKVTAQPDLEALNYIMQSYLLDSIKKYIDDLPNLKGSAIILDDNSERIYPMRVRPRFTWHGGEAPAAMKAEKRL